jgi:hypothetical protein
MRVACLLPDSLAPPPAARERGILVALGGIDLDGAEASDTISRRAAAIELAKSYPHARWGPVEVREILFLDPVSERTPQPN